jgi:hypothetical protein
MFGDSLGGGSALAMPAFTEDEGNRATEVFIHT